MKHIRQLVCEPTDDIPETVWGETYKLNEKGICPNCNGNYFYDIGVEECPYCVAGYRVRGQ